MCVAAIAWQAHERWQLVAVGNRDEYHARAAAPLAAWDNGILAGRDLEAGGTWLGISPGRFGLVTNLRAEGYPRAGMASRGGLVTGWLTGEPVRAIETMNPFNLFVAGPDGARFVTNHPVTREEMLTPGVHGISNCPFGESWHKIVRLERALGSWLKTQDDPGALFDALFDSTPDPDAAARMAGPDAPFSSVFIRNPVYGTRCSTVVAVDRDGHGSIVERRFAEDGSETGRTALEFVWPA